MEVSKLFVSLPNLITLVRLLLAPLAVSMIASQRFVEAFLIFLAAGISDAVDGFIAKRFDLRTELGAYLDPLADKALLVSIYVTLAIVGVVPTALAILVVSRDLMILAAVLVSWLLDNPSRPRVENQHHRANLFCCSGFGRQGLWPEPGSVAGYRRLACRLLHFGLGGRVYKPVARPHDSLRSFHEAEHWLCDLYRAGL
jgi:CDP-alcohol phosphatidyltransferase